MAKLLYGVSPTSNIIRVKLMDSTSSTGAGLSGLTFSATGLKISTIQISEVSATTYTAAGSTIETITTIGTFSAPTATKCRFKEIDSTNMPGIYEIQIADARFASTTSLLISITGATNLAQQDFEVQCVNIAANVTQALGTAVTTATAGILDVNTKNINNAAVNTGIAQIGATVIGNVSGTVASVTGAVGSVTGAVGSVASTVSANVTQALGTAVTTATAGILDVNAKRINNVSTSAVTAVNADQGTTQPINFTGTGATAYVKSDMIDVAGAAVSTGVAQIGVTVIGNVSGSVASVTGAVGSVTGNVGGNLVGNVSGSIGANRGGVSGSVNSVVTPVTVGTNNDKTNYTVSAGTITTVTGAVGSVTSPVTVGTNNDKTNYTVSAGTITTVTGNVNGSVASVTGAVGSVTGSVGGNVSGSVASVTGNVAGNVTGSVNNVLTTVSANVVQINSITSAATNLGSQFNGTGLIGDTYPARQDQLSNIVSTGASVNQTAESFVQVSGTQTGTYLNTQSRDGVIHQLSDSAGNLDCYYEFDIGSTGVPASVQLYMANTGTNDTVRFFGWNWAGSAWIELGSKVGTAGITYSIQTFPMYTSMVGTGLNNGKVRIRLFNTGLTTSNTYVDQIFVSYAIVNQSVGYARGAIWIDTLTGVSGTTPYVNGTADKPVLTYADANTLATALNLHSFVVIAGSTITFTVNHDYDSFQGAGGQWNLNLNGQSITGAYISDANVSGTGIGTSSPTFRNCALLPGTSLIPSYFDHCGFNTSIGSPFTAISAGQYLMTDCMSLVAGSGTPYFVFSGTNGTTGINFRRWSGGTNTTLDSNCTASLEVVVGGGQTMNVNGGNAEFRGIFRAATLTGITSASTVQLASVTGPISIAGTDGIVRIYGVCGVVTDSRTGAPTLVNNAISNTNISVDVWDELRSLHTSAGTFGSGIANVVGNVSGSVNSVVTPVTVGTNNDKTNYTVSAGTVTSVTNDVGITQAGADKVWSSTTRALTDKINFSISGGTLTTNLDKTNYTVSAGTITNVTGNVSGSVASVTSPVTVGTNNDKTNYTVSAGTITTVTGAVGSVTGNVGGNLVGNVSGSVASVTGNVTGSVGSVTSPVTVGTNNDKTNYSISGGTLTTNLDKTNYTVSAGTVNAVTGDVGITQVGADKVWSSTTRALTDKINFSISGGTLTTNLDKTNYTVSAGTITNVTGAVGSVTGNVGGNLVGNVSGSVASVRGDVAGNVSGSVNNVVNNTATVSGSVTLASNVTNTGIIASSVLITSANKIATDSNGYVTVGTNLDKTNYTVSAGTVNNVTGNVSGSVASVTGAIGSVSSPVTVGTNNDKTNYTISGGTVNTITGNVTVGTNLDKTNYTVSAGTVNAVTGDVGITQVGADKVWSSTTRALTDKINFSISGGTLTTNLDKTNYTVSAGTIDTLTGNISGSVASVTGSVGSVTSPVTVGTNLDKTNYTVSAGTINTLTGNISGSVASVTGNVGGNIVGNVSGSVNSVVTPVTVGTNQDKANYTISGGTITTVSDKSNYSLTTAEHTLIQSDASKGILLTSANKLLTDSSGYVTSNTVTGNVNGNILGDVQGTVQGLSGSTGSIADTSANRQVIANALKVEDVSLIPAVSGSVYQDIINSIVLGEKGKNTLSLKTTDELGNVVAGVWVGIYNVSNVLIRNKITDDNGLVSGAQALLLDDGTYTGRFSKSLFNYDIQTFVISGDSSYTVSGTRFVPTSASAGIQTVYGYVIHGDGTNASACTVIAELESIGDFSDGYQITTRKITATTTSAGYFEIALKTGCDFKISEVWNGKSYFMKTIIVTSDLVKDITTYE